MMFPGKTSSLVSSQIIHSANPIFQTLFKHWDYTAWTDAKSAFMEPESKSVSHSVMPNCSDSKEPACNAGDLGLIPGFGRSLEKGMTTHSSILAWRIPWTEEPGESMGLQSQT